MIKEIVNAINKTALSCPVELERNDRQKMIIY